MFYQKTMLSTVIPLTLMSLLATGCTSTNQEKGATIGAITGAILGKSTSNHKDKRAIFGAAIGAIAGAAVGDYMDKQEKEFRQELSDSDIDIVREGDNLRLIMPSNITFSTGQSIISVNFYSTLNAIAGVLHKYKRTILTIEGHTDSQGTYQFNQLLSEQRADSVKQYLLNQAIYEQRLKTIAFGETQPIANNATVEGRALNRRVEIRIIPNKQR